MYTVTFNNEAGALESRAAQTAEQAAAVAIEMIKDAGVLYDGDSITIRDDDE